MRRLAYTLSNPSVSQTTEINPLIYWAWECPLSWQNLCPHCLSSPVQFRLVAQSCLTLCNPLDCSHQASLSITNSWSLLKLISSEFVMPSNHHILCCPLLFLPSIFPSIRVYSKESVLLIRWPKCWSFSFSISPSNEYSGLISFSNTTVQKHQFFSSQPSLWSNIRTWLLENP